MEQLRYDRPQNGEVVVKHGVNSMMFEGLAGTTLAQARRTLEAIFDMQADLRVLADGHPVGEDHVIRPNELLEFIQEAGKKG